MKNFTFVIIDDNHKNGLKTRAIATSFPNLSFLASASCYDDGIDCVLEYTPDLVFLEIDPEDKTSQLSLNFINELHRHLAFVPKIIVTSNNDSHCLEAIKYGVFDYFINPIQAKELRKTLFRLEKESQKSLVLKKPNFIEEESKTSLEVEVIDEVAVLLEEKSDNKKNSFFKDKSDSVKPLIICVKSYGDYRYIDSKDICYLRADNNSTDIHLSNGEMITAFKTLKHFEGVMTYPFVRIHNSYIANVDYISRIHTGNAVCHIKNTTTKLPFSKSYKENVDAIITTIASGNYLEI